MRRRFNLVALAEFVGIAAALNVLSRRGHPEMDCGSTCAAAGLRFIPLARLVRVRLYTAAAALPLTAGTAFVLAASGAPDLVWQLVTLLAPD